MMKQNSSQSTARTARLYNALSGEEVRVALLDNRGIAHQSLARDARPDLGKSGFAPDRAEGDGNALPEHSAWSPRLSEDDDPIEFDRVAAPDAARSERWNWHTSSWEAVVTLWSHWRREREIEQAVAALAEFDDRTLRDIGIPHRSQIERTVRYGRDC